MDSARLSSATEIAAAIREGRTTSRAVVDEHIALVRRTHGRVRAAVCTRFDAARAEADAADEAVRRGDAEAQRPFHGVPMTVKESFALEGMPNTAGLLSRHGVIADRDAVTVARLRAAGAIPLAVTNVSELCMWMESVNPVYGRSNNPYDARRTCGGSSGGEGAIVGAGASPIGLGADIGGSIRLPAFFCGVFGHKPTGGLVPGSGQYPIAENDALRYLTTGPIARRAEDLFPFLEVIAGPDGEDPVCEARTLGAPSDVAIEGLRVVVIEDNGFTPVSEDLRQAQRRAADALAAKGARVEHRRVPSLRRSLELWSAAMSLAADTSFTELLRDGGHLSVGRELLRAAFGAGRFTLPALGLAVIERIPLLHGDAARAMVDQAAAMRTELETLIGEDGVFLYPPYARVAPKHGHALLRPLHWVYTAVLNVLELPSTQVPLGLDRQAVPLGVQVVGCRGQDHRTIAVAHALEESFGGWVPPAL